MESAKRKLVGKLKHFKHFVYKIDIFISVLKLATGKKYIKNSCEFKSEILHNLYQKKLYLDILKSGKYILLLINDKLFYGK